MHALEADEVYIDRMSGKSTDRPELKRMLSFVRQGDIVIVESISRFARNTRDLLELVECYEDLWEKLAVRMYECGQKEPL